VNGIVLPSGHEVRWHGRKERMESHSPVPPANRAAVGAAAAAALVEATAAGMAAAPTAAEGPPAVEGARLVPAEVPARLVNAAEAQLSALLQRVASAEASASEAEALFNAAQSQLAAREEALARVSSQLAAALDAGPPAEARRVEQQSAAAAIGQLSSQVDFLNARCAQLEGALGEESAKSHAARFEADERQRYLDAIAELQHDKQVLQAELEHAASIASQLGLARPAAVAPFA
jgi:outer membrane murein-binding lipoprotein Lpp